MSALTDPATSADPPATAWAQVRISEHVAHVSLTAKGKISRQGPEFWLEMPQLFNWLDASPDVRVVLLSGEGDGFSAGLDLLAMAPDLATLAAPDAGARARSRLLELILRMQQATSAVARCRKPVIAAIHGWCLGGGVDLASACDIRLCSADAKFSVREVKLAIVADMGSLARLPAIIGQGATRELALTGDDFDAVRARELQFVSRVLPTRDELSAEAHAMARRIAQNPPLVVEGIKAILNARAEHDAQQSLSAVAVWNSAFLPSRDLTEAIGAFVEKRPPNFTGE